MPASKPTGAQILGLTGRALEAWKRSTKHQRAQIMLATLALYELTFREALFAYQDGQTLVEYAAAKRRGPITTTSTGRFSSSTPNMQNIPRPLARDGALHLRYR